MAPASFYKHVHSFSGHDTRPVPAARLLLSSSESPDRLPTAVVTSQGKNTFLRQKSVVVLEVTSVILAIKLTTIVFTCITATILLVIS